MATGNRIVDAMSPAHEPHSELRKLIEKKRAGMEAFARWEASHPAAPDLAHVFASLGALYDLIPPDQRRQHENLRRPEVRRMHECLAALS